MHLLSQELAQTLHAVPSILYGAKGVGRGGARRAYMGWVFESMDLCVCGGGGV
jgi:hypothetical protein